MSDKIQDQVLSGEPSMFSQNPNNFNNIFMFRSNVELKSNPTVVSSPELMGRMEESSGTKSKLDESSSKNPLVECDGGIEEGSGSKGRQSKKARSSEIHLSCERRRRDRLRERMRALKALLPNNANSKSDQATLLDQAIRHIKFLQSQLQAVSSGGVHAAYHVSGMPAYEYSVQKPTVSAPARLEGLGMDPGMAIQAGFSPLSRLMAPSASTCVIPGLHSTYPIIADSSYHHIPDITQHGFWASSTQEMLLRPVDNDVSFSSLSNVNALPFPALLGSSSTFGPGIQSQVTPLMPHQFNYLEVMSSSTTSSSSLAPSTTPRHSAFRQYPHGESSSQVVPTIDTNQTPLMQDPFAMIQYLQRLPTTSLGSIPLEMVPQIDQNQNNTNI